jgi:hypothetical protein
MLFWILKYRHPQGKPFLSRTIHGPYIDPLLYSLNSILTAYICFQQCKFVFGKSQDCSAGGQSHSYFHSFMLQMYHLALGFYVYKLDLFMWDSFWKHVFNMVHDRSKQHWHVPFVTVIMPGWSRVCYMFYVWDMLIRWQKEGYTLPRDLLVVGNFFSGHLYCTSKFLILSFMKDGH